MQKLYILAVLFVALFGTNCKNDLDVLSSYQESVAVYGLLDHTDTINYIRVNKVFLGTIDANVMAQQQDSNYFGAGEITVKLERIKNGVFVSVDNPATAIKEIILDDTIMPLQSGIFNINQRLYYTKHKLYNDCEYKLTITNNKTGKIYYAQTEMIGNFNPICGSTSEIVSFACKPNITFAAVSNGKLRAPLIAANNARICGVKLRLYYKDSIIGLPNAIPHIVDMELGEKVTPGPEGIDNIDFTTSSISFYYNLANKLSPGDGNMLGRRCDSVRFIMTFGGEELNTYNEVNGPSSSLAQEKPIYTNIKGGGVGIFSCRAKYYIKKRISCVTLDNMDSNSITAPLKFYASADYPPSSCQ